MLWFSLPLPSWWTASHSPVICRNLLFLSLLSFCETEDSASLESKHSCRWQPCLFNQIPGDVLRVGGSMVSMATLRPQGYYFLGPDMWQGT